MPVAGDPDHIAADDLQPAGRVENRLIEQLAQIGAIGETRDEGLRGAGDAALVEPANEMTGVVGEGAHVGRADIEEVRRMGGTEGEPSAGFAMPIDQRGARTIVAYEIDRGERSRKTSSDNRDMIDHDAGVWWSVIFPRAMSAILKGF